jgi:DnaJ-class molecular chaperone
LEDYIKESSHDIEIERRRKCYKCSGFKYDIDSEVIICNSCKGKGKKEIIGLFGYLKDNINCHNCYGQGYSYNLECE